MRAPLLSSVLVFSWCVCALAGQADGVRRTAIAIARGTPWETRAVLVDSGVDGPEVMVVGGVHGDEPAGYRAARQIAGWLPVRGRLLVIPRANAPALEAGTRRMPDLPKADSDLNRQFPKAEGDDPSGILAAALWALAVERAPDLILDLHEGYDFTQINPKSVGSSVIHDGSEATAAHAGAMLAAVNAEVRAFSADPAQKDFVLKARAVIGSLARAAHDRLGIATMIVETTKKGQALAYRARQHRVLVHAVLARLGMIEHGPHVLVGDAAEGALTVGLYVSKGVGGKGPARLEALLDDEAGFCVRQLCAADVRTGAIEPFDVVVFPGGSGSGQGRAIGAEGRERVREFVRAGGGYVGLCAGAYLAANNYDWSLGILDADVVDRAHWKRGRGTVPLGWTDAARGLGLVVSAAPTPVLYANGPLYAPSDDPAIPDFEVLARFEAEIRENDAPEGVMLGKPAVVIGRFGAGRVVCSSPHPEQTEGLADAMRALVRLAGGER